jgi:hypothetical protein
MFRVQVFAVCKFWPGPRSVSTDISGLEPCQGIGAGLTDGSAKHRICLRLLGSKSVTDAKKINSIQFNSDQTHGRMLSICLQSTASISGTYLTHGRLHSISPSLSSFAKRARSASRNFFPEPASAIAIPSYCRCGV